MTNIDNDILLLEKFINEEKDRLNEGVISTIAAVMSIPVILQAISLALTKFNTFKLKFYIPDVKIDEPTLKSLLYPRGSESVVSDKDIKYSPELVQNIIKFINKYGMEGANALNKYNNKEKLEFAKRSPVNQVLKDKRAFLSSDDPVYQLTLMLNSIQQNMQMIIDEMFETVSASIIEAINLHPEITISLDRKYYSSIVTKLSKIVLFVVVGASIFQSTDTEGAKSLASKGLGIFKKFKNGKKFYDFLKELDIFLVEIASFAGEAGVATQLASIVEINYAARAINYIKEAITKLQEDLEIDASLVSLERKITDYFKEGNVKSPSYQDTLKLVKGIDDAKARQDSLAGTDYYGDPVDRSKMVDSFLRQYIEMILS